MLVSQIMGIRLGYETWARPAIHLAKVSPARHSEGGSPDSHREVLGRQTGSGIGPAARCQAFLEGNADLAE